MKIFIDSAKVSTWHLPAGCPPVQGATTNPSLVFQAGLPVSLPSYENLIHAAGGHGLAELMLQLPTNDPTQAVQWLEQLRKVASQENVQLTIKLPCAASWLPCIQAVQQAGQAVLLTGLSNPVQLLWAQSLDVAYVAPYVGRLATDGRDVWALMEACVAVQAHGPGLLAASIKTPDVLARLMACGAAAVTLPPASLTAWSSDELTQTAITQFDRDTDASQSFKI